MIASIKQKKGNSFQSNSRFMDKEKLGDVQPASTKNVSLLDKYNAVYREEQKCQHKKKDNKQYKLNQSIQFRYSFISYITINKKRIGGNLCQSIYELEQQKIINKLIM